MNEPTETERAEISIGDVVRQLRALGVKEGRVLLVHTSYRAVRPIEGGPRGLIEALTRSLGKEGTLVMPSWSDGVHLFDPETSPAAPSLGVVANEFWQTPGVKRTTHAQAFAARGPHAERILSDPLPLPPHIPESPVGRVYDLDGQVLLIGVNHDANTTAHLAEIIARVPYGVPKRCLTLVDGVPKLIEYRENDHCCARFKLVDGWLDHRQVKGSVGHAESRLMSSRDIVDVVVPRLQRDPLFFLHSVSAGCEECDEARFSVVT